MKPTLGSLFAGIGGIDLGFERAGFETKWQVEIDDYASRVLAKHWPHVHRERDIRECGPHNLERVDCIAGGFPCQDISYAGLGAGLDGERSGLFFEAVRLVRQLQPRVVVLENVAALLTRGLDRVLGTLAAIGYDAEWHCIPAAYVGAPHIRDRIFILGYSNSSRRETRKQTRASARYRVSIGATNHDAASMADSVGKRRNKKRDDHKEHDRNVASAKGEQHGPDSDCNRREQMEQEIEFGAKGKWTVYSAIERIGRIRPSDCWQFEPDVGRVAHGVPARVDRLRGLGNAVVPQVAEYVAKIALEKLGR